MIIDVFFGMMEDILILDHCRRCFEPPVVKGSFDKILDGITYDFCLMMV
jgi:hypothetical protein